MKISVIIPVYNVETYLQKCVDSILGQTYKDFELLLINDGSTDSSPMICDNYAKQDSRVKVFHKENEGVSRTRNFGLEKAEGDWVWFVDSDDYAEPDTLQRFVDVVSDHPDIDIYKFGFDMEGSNKNMTFQASEPVLLTSTSRMILELETNCYTGFLWNTIFRRSVIGNKKFNEDISYCEDHLFSFNAFSEARLLYIDQNIGYHYIVKDSGNNLSNIHRHSALNIVKAACMNRDAKLKCIEVGANKDVVDRLMQKIVHSHKEQLYVAYEVLYSHPFNYKESKAVFCMINHRLPVPCAWLYYYLRYRIHKYRFERSLK